VVVPWLERAEFGVGDDAALVENRVRGLPGCGPPVAAAHRGGYASSARRTAQLGGRGSTGGGWVANRQKSRDGFPWTEVLIVGVIAMATAAFVDGGIGWSLGGGNAGGGTRMAPPVVASGSTAASQPAGPVDPAVAAGAHDFVQFGCGQCHGADGSGGISLYVPALDTLRTSLTAAQLSSIIEHGAGVSANPTHPYMPIWHGIVSKHQISDLVAYIHAGLPTVTVAAPAIVPTNQGLAVEGQAIYIRDGCVNSTAPTGWAACPTRPRRTRRSRPFRAPISGMNSTPPRRSKTSSCLEACSGARRL